jgi:predicted permease
VAFNVAVFAVVQAYLLRPLPYPDARRIVQIQPATPAVGWKTSDDVFEKAVSWELAGFTLVDDAGPDPEVVLGARVSPDFFDVFGVRPALGRTFSAADRDPRVAVIGYDVWQRRFGGDPGVLGRTLATYPSGQGAGQLESFTIIGVLPRDFWYLNGYTEVLLPMVDDGPVYVGRLRPDMTPERAEEVIGSRAASELQASGEDASPRLRSLQRAYTAALRPRLAVFQAMAVLVLLVACINAALLLMLRSEGRGREMGMRRALGAGRGRLAVQLVSEGVVLAALAGALGLSLGTGGLALLGRAVQARLGRAVPGGAGALHVDAWTVVLTTVACLLVGLAFGAVPLWTAVRRDPVGVLRSAARSVISSPRARRARGILITAEVALSVALVTGGALMVRSALHLERIDLGFNPSGLAAYTVGLTSRGSEDPGRRQAFFEQLARRVGREHGVGSVGLVRGAPFDLTLTARPVRPASPEDRVDVEAVPQVASPGYFATLGITPVRGRLPTEADERGGPPVAVVSASLARVLWPRTSGVGERLRFPSWRMPEMSEEPGALRTVVGVVPDVVDGVEGTRPTVYVPFRQAPLDWMALVVRLQPGAPDPTARIRSVLHDLDPEIPVYAHRTLEEAIARARAPARFFAGLLGGFSSFALLLSLMGLYAVAAYAVRSGRRDVAVRMALGAREGSVQGLFLRRSLGTLGVGLALGALGGRLLGQALSGQLHGVAPGDPATAAVVTILFAATALLAVWLPARRAARTDPGIVLREE